MAGDNVAAPFLTPNDLTAQQGDAALGGVQVNFDPAVKAPLQPLEETFNRLDSENNASIQQQKQRQHDLLTRQMQFDHEDAVNKYHQAMLDRQNMFNFFNQTGETAATIKDARTGASLAIPFLPEDKKILSEETDTFKDRVFNNADGWAGFQGDAKAQDHWNELHDKRVNASMRAKFYKEAEQGLANSFDPRERERLKGYMENLRNQPLDGNNMPMPYISQPSIKPVIDVEKDYKKGEGFDEFEDGRGVPNRRYHALLNTTDPEMIENGFKKYKFFKDQYERQDPALYQSYQDHLNELTDKRGFDRIDLGGRVTQDGKLVFDDSTYAKQQQLAKKYLTAFELTNNGHLDNGSESDELDNEVKRAQIKKYNAESHEKEQGKNTKPTKEELVEERDKKSVRSMVNNVKDVYSKVTEGKSPITPAYAGFWERNGIKPSEYDIYPSVSSNVAGKFIGIPTEAESTTTDASGVKTTTKSPPSSMGVDRIVPIRDKATKELKLAYIADNKVVNIVSEKQAVSNGIKHEAHYDPKGYENKTAWVDELFDGDRSQKSTASQTFTPKYNGADVKVRNNGGVFEANVNGSWKKIKARNSKTGEIKVE